MESCPVSKHPSPVRLTARPTCSTALLVSATPSGQATWSQTCSTSTQLGATLTSTALSPGEAQWTLVWQYAGTTGSTVH